MPHFYATMDEGRKAQRMSKKPSIIVPIFFSTTPPPAIIHSPPWHWIRNYSTTWFTALGTVNLRSSGTLILHRNTISRRTKQATLHCTWPVQTTILVKSESNFIQYLYLPSTDAVDVISFILELLTQYKGDQVKNFVNIQNNEGNTPLHWAALNGHLEAVELLVKSGGDCRVRRCYCKEKKRCNNGTDGSFFGRSRTKQDIPRLMKHSREDTKRWQNTFCRQWLKKSRMNLWARTNNS